MVPPDAARSNDVSAPPLTLVLGGARSGKSAYAESFIEDHAARNGGGCVYLATAEAGDDEMAARIAAHRARRGSRWTTIEEPVALADALERAGRGGDAVLVDCLTLWLANLMARGRDVDGESRRLAAALSGIAGPVALIANEVGLGIVPDNAEARAFRDHAGRLNQALAARADRVVLVTAGLPLVLKG